MQKARFVKDIKEGEQIRDLFLVSNKAVLSSNAGKAYLSLALRDRTGQVECRVWDRAEEIAKLRVNESEWAKKDMSHDGPEVNDIFPSTIHFVVF